LTLSSILPAVFTGAVFAYAVWRLPLLHPVQVWSGSWAVATTLYALRLLPYRDLSWLTAALICGSIVAFAVGVGAGGRLALIRPVARAPVEDFDRVKLAAHASLVLLACSLGVFLEQLISRFGAARVLRVTPDVKLYLSSGEAPFSGTYVNVAVATTALCAIAAALAGPTRSRRRWTVAATLCAASVYFCTSRGFVAIAIVAGLSALAVSRMVNMRRLAVMVATAVVIITVSFFALGSLLGKTYDSAHIGQFNNFFSRHPAVSRLALPYQDLTASIPALDLLVRYSSTWGRGEGCATAPIPCGIVRKLGLPVVRVPVAGPFTNVPLQWNAYTFLDRFLIDGGTALALLFVAGTGVLAGFFWARARAGSVLGMVVYAIGVPALFGAYRQNLLELVGLSAILAMVLLALARVALPLRTRMRERARVPQRRVEPAT
jgi:oligosaccharide repeat unit polymerase